VKCHSKLNYVSNCIGYFVCNCIGILFVICNFILQFCCVSTTNLLICIYMRLRITYTRDWGYFMIKRHHSTKSTHFARTLHRQYTKRDTPIRRTAQLNHHKRHLFCILLYIKLYIFYYSVLFVCLEYVCLVSRSTRDIYGGSSGIEHVMDGTTQQVTHYSL